MSLHEQCCVPVLLCVTHIEVNLCVCLHSSSAMRLLPTRVVSSAANRVRDGSGSANLVVQSVCGTLRWDDVSEPERQIIECVDEQTERVTVVEWLIGEVFDAERSGEGIMQRRRAGLRKSLLAGRALDEC